uniref:Putative gamma-glutamylcyclotransferase n=1 Tax=Chromera velia CCMP2878 TaxID=1169474 RepID=A0A0G4I1X1_9ALVE|eukprot:Cvel_10249.t1-p1 / transcript=Cvel_10249.t1 / gene=Cvel_10249 / organism=Chromera_velia_CCMP2878 / gene_product=AIG2-like protein, putative / transcript_product=AIG2-like protein, putative / location=Cvel_scaffold614:33625-35624(+) / protein_length=161 / sequence_SO=supercontig / SO=protein_coding / is_pseudo=false
MSAAHKGALVFVYGSLMHPQVVQTLLGRQPDEKSATLTGYSRHPLKECVYPGITKVDEKEGGSSDGSNSSSRVVGKVLSVDMERELPIFDAFEDDEYKRETLDVELDDGSLVSAFVYVWTVKEALVFQEKWEMDEEFEKVHLEKYLQMCEEFVKNGYRFDD